MVATVDDDNIPYSNWGEELLVGQEVEIDSYECLSAPYFDPLSVTEHNSVWHRGYPIEHVPNRLNVEFKGKRYRKCLVQANLWDGDPDIDAMARLANKPIVKFDPQLSPYGSDQLSPFNSQNTILARDVIPYYSVLPFTGRMDDIWGGYILQHYFPESVIYAKATVYQDRNEQDLVTNLENEVVGYRKTLTLLEAIGDYQEVLPEKAKIFWDVYRKQYSQPNVLEVAAQHFMKFQSQ